MRRLKSDVSHRIRPRGRSIFSARWFRLLLGSGVAVILGLVFGPSVAGWFVTDLPPGFRLLSPRSNSEPSGAPGWTTERAEPEVSSANTQPTASPSRVVEAPTLPGKTPTTATGLTAPPPVFRIQVGAFLDPANADRLVERLRSEGFGAATSVFEQSRVLHRILVSPGEDTPAKLFERLRALGFAAEMTDEGPALSGLVPLHAAVEASHRLREQGMRVRLKQDVGSSTYRVVRVGSYESSEEADQALASLVARGFEGFVVRER